MEMSQENRLGWRGMEWDTGLLLLLEEDGQDTKEWIRLESHGV